MKQNYFFYIVGLFLTIGGWVNSENIIEKQTQEDIFDELSSIEKRIQFLEGQLNINEHLEMEEQIDGQGHMLADTAKYAQDLEKVRQLQEKDKEILKEIKALESRKVKLLSE